MAEHGTVRDYTTKDPLLLRPQQTVGDAAAMFGEFWVRFSPVIGGGGTVVGVISASDVLGQGTPPDPHMTLRDAMSKDVVSVRLDEPVTEAAAIMVTHAIHHLVVTEDDGNRLAGVVSVWDLARAVADEDPSIPLSEIMTADPLSMPITSTISECYAALTESGHQVLVLTKEGVPVGGLTRVALVRTLARDSYAIAADALEPGPPVLRPDDTLGRAATLMVEHASDYVLVAAEGRGPAIGIVTSTDAARWLAEQ